jgi:hypothetical protein
MRVMLMKDGGGVVDDHLYDYAKDEVADASS